MVKQSGIDNQMSLSFRRTIAHKIIQSLERDEIPWQRPWIGWGENIGIPSHVYSRKRYCGINFVLLQMAAKKHKFVNKWWGTVSDFKILCNQIKNRPNSVEPGEWATGLVLYEENSLTPVLAYNVEQVEGIVRGTVPNRIMIPDYSDAERVLHGTDAKIKYNEAGESFYYYPPEDYITLPRKSIFEVGLGKLPNYYDCLAHELIHWTETRLDFYPDTDEERELRAEIGTAMLMEELHVPHSIVNINFENYREKWIEQMKGDMKLIFRIAASASKAVNYILSFTWQGTVPTYYNEVAENVV